MYTNGQWPGHGQPETPEIFREIVEDMPQIPVGKITKGMKALIAKLRTSHESEVEVADPCCQGNWSKTASRS